jgi:hypothetical protein
LRTYVVKLSTELVSDDSADIRQNLSLVLHEGYVLNNQHLLKKKATTPETGDHAKFDIYKQIDLQRPCTQDAGHGKHGGPEPEEKETWQVVS